MQHAEPEILNPQEVATLEGWRRKVIAHSEAIKKIVAKAKSGQFPRYDYKTDMAREFTGLKQVFALAINTGKREALIAELERAGYGNFSGIGAENTATKH